MRKLIGNIAALSLALLFGCSHRQPTDSDLFNASAAIDTGKLPFNPLHWKVITSGIDSQHGTMSTLYGNDQAVESARAGRSTYPDGSVLSLVTWTQREDPHWFGGRIPGTVQSVEFVTVGKNSANVGYQRFEGPELTQVKLQDLQNVFPRLNMILAERAVVMP